MRPATNLGGKCGKLQRGLGVGGSVTRQPSCAERSMRTIWPHLRALRRSPRATHLTVGERKVIVERALAASPAARVLAGVGGVAIRVGLPLLLLPPPLLLLLPCRLVERGQPSLGPLLSRALPQPPLSLVEGLRRRVWIIARNLDGPTEGSGPSHLDVALQPLARCRLPPRLLQDLFCLTHELGRHGRAVLPRNRALGLADRRVELGLAPVGHRCPQPR